MVRPRTRAGGLDDSYMPPCQDSLSMQKEKQVGTCWEEREKISTICIRNK